jgi:hypothetical protein
MRDLGARRGWVVSTTPLPLYPRERPGTHCTGGWVGPRAVWTCAKNLASTGIFLNCSNSIIITEFYLMYSTALIVVCVPSSWRTPICTYKPCRTVDERSKYWGSLQSLYLCRPPARSVCLGVFASQEPVPCWPCHVWFTRHPLPTLVPSLFDPRTVQPVASRYTDWATRPTSKHVETLNS